MGDGEERLLVLSHGGYGGTNDDILVTSDQATVDATHERRYLLRASLPLLVTFTLQSGLWLTSVVATGQLGSLAIGGATLALCTYNITGIALFQGFATSLDYFCSRAYGSGAYKEVGLYVQRCSMICAACTIPMAVLWWFSGPVLALMVEDVEVCTMAQTYLRINMLGAPGLMLFETGKRFLQAQHIFNPGTYILCIATAVNIGLHYFLVSTFGYVGAPVAISITNWVMLAMLIGYIVCNPKCQICWDGVDIKGAFRHWRPMLKLALPGVIMVEAEYLAFEILTIWAAAFGTNALAAQSVASNITSLIFQLPFSVSVAASTKMGNYIGKKNADGAKCVSRIAYAFGGTIAIFDTVVIYVFRRQIARCFVRDPEVIQIASTVLTLAAINHISDCINIIFAGILRGQGRQQIGSILNLGCYYVVAIPLAYNLAFKTTIGFYGLWYGTIIGVMALTLSEGLAIGVSNWDVITRNEVI
ncbi:ethionine resistance-conferring protein 1 [Diutina catenulata]